MDTPQCAQTCGEASVLPEDPPGIDVDQPWLVAVYFNGNLTMLSPIQQGNFRTQLTKKLAEHEQFGEGEIQSVQLFQNVRRITKQSGPRSPNIASCPVCC
jgi:hypothetical protein